MSTIRIFGWGFFCSSEASSVSGILAKLFQSAGCFNWSFPALRFPSASGRAVQVNESLASFCSPFSSAPGIRMQKDTPLPHCFRTQFYSYSLKNCLTEVPHTICLYCFLWLQDPEVYCSWVKNILNFEQLTMDIWLPKYANQARLYEMSGLVYYQST